MTPLEESLCTRVIGHPAAISRIAGYVEAYQVGIAPPTRPAGICMLLGPTGTGKTRTAEVLAEVLHGEEDKLLRINCAEFQMEHEVSKLIGAPPGFLGHRETAPIITQGKLQALRLNSSNPAVVLFDELEKAAPSLTRLLLGVMDNGELQLGSGDLVSFQDTLLLFTSNVGARRMLDMESQKFNFGARREATTKQYDAVGCRAIVQRFAPEFINRVDEIIVYHPLSYDSLQRILELELDRLRRQVALCGPPGWKHNQPRERPYGLKLDVSNRAKGLLLREGTSREYGVRPLKRVLHKRILVPLTRLVNQCYRENKPVIGATVLVQSVRNTVQLSLNYPSTRKAVAG